jgi:small GTP-binding protein
VCFVGEGGHTDSQNKMDEFNVLITGDEQVGKTSLCLALQHSEFQENVISVADAFVAEIKLTDGKVVKLKIVDTSSTFAGRDHRRGGYYKVDVVVMCCALNSEDSLKHTSSKWLDEVLNFFYCEPENFPEIMVVGLKKDLVDEEKQNELFESVNMTSPKFENAIMCSSKSAEDVKLVFQQVAKVAAGRRSQKQMNNCY